MWCECLLLRRREAPDRSEGRRIQVTYGLRDINAGMADDTDGFRDGGFVRPGAVRFGCHLPGLGEETDGVFALDTGCNSVVSSGPLVNERRFRLDWGEPSGSTTP